MNKSMCVMTEARISLTVQTLKCLWKNSEDKEDPLLILHQLTVGNPQPLNFFLGLEVQYAVHCTTVYYSISLHWCIVNELWFRTYKQTVFYSSCNCLKSWSFLSVNRFFSSPIQCIHPKLHPILACPENPNLGNNIHIQVRDSSSHLCI